MGAQILAKDAEDPDPETLMRRLQTGCREIINLTVERIKESTVRAERLRLLTCRCKSR